MEKQDLWVDKIPYLRKLKSFFAGIEYKEVNFWPVMANEAYTFYKSQDRTQEDIRKLILRMIFFRDNLKIDGSKGKILTSYFMPRDDHHSLVGKAISAFPKEEIFFLDAYWHKKNPQEKYKPTIPNPFRLFSIWFKFHRYDLKRVLGKYYWLFIARTYQRYTQIKYFEKILKKLEPKGYIAFCSPVFGEEAIMSIICKKKGIPTFSLQHGLIVNYPEFSPQEILNENVLADYTLLWGETSYDVQKKYVNPERLMIVGNPKYVKTEIKKRKNNLMKKGLILFPVTGNDETRDNLIKITANISSTYKDVEFKVSVHPFDDLNHYKKNLTNKNIHFIEKGVDIKKVMEESDFIVLHNTTLAMEALNYGIPIFRYGDQAFISMWDNEDIFKDEEGLKNLMKKAKENKTMSKWLKKYREELKRTFYFHDKKDVSQVYYDEINSKIKNFSNEKTMQPRKKYHSVGIIAFKSKSERVTGKNLRNFSGKPLWIHMVQKALKSNLDKVFVITNNEEAKRQAKSLGAEVLEVPDWYFGKEVTGDKMISFPAELIDADIYLQLFVTAPFLSSETINKAIKVLEKSNHDSVFTVNKKHDWAWFNGKPITYFPGNLPRSQDAIPLMVETTGVYGIKKDALNKYKRRVGNSPFMLEVDEIEGLDIDEDSDFLMAEIIAENMSKVKRITKKDYGIVSK